MTPIKLSGIGIAENDVEYVFNEPKDLYTQKTADEIKQCILYAFYGNDALYSGEVRFEFVSGEDTYVIHRDFAGNRVTLTRNGEEIPASGVDATLSSLVKLTQGQTTEFVFASKQAAYAGVTEDVGKFTEDTFDALKLTTDTAAESAEELKKEIASLSSKIEVLGGIAEDERGMERKSEELQTEIRSIEADSARLKELIGVGTVGKTTEAKLKQAKSGLEETLRQKDEIEEKKQKLARSEEIKKNRAILEEIAKAEGELREAEEKLSDTEEKLAASEAEIATGEKVLKKREREFLDATVRVKALNAAFDEMIAKNREDYKNGEYVKGLAQKAYVDEQGAIGAMKERLNVLLEENAELTKKIDASRRQLAAVRSTAAERKAVREGACFEIVVEEKKAFLAETEKEIEEEERSLATLRAEVIRNREEITVCKDELRVLFGSTASGRKSLAELVKEYNELERQKQGLYRNQILSATLLQDVNAIDKKIADNTEMCSNSVENKNALENAKATLLAYTQKCNEALNKKYEESNAVKAEKKFYEDLDSLEYGSKCPVCSAPISDKADAEGKARALEKKEAELQKEIDRLHGIKVEYADKLNRINVSLGSYESAIATSTGYVASLEQTKLAKLSALRKIYKENGVENHTELTAALEKAVAKIAEYGAVIANVKGVVARQEAAEKTLAVAERRMENTENVTLPEKRAVAEQLRWDVERYTKGRENLDVVLDGASALDQLDSVISSEEAEDAYFADVSTLQDRKAEVESEIDALTKEIDARESKAYAFKDEKVSYEDYVIKAAAEQYNEVVDEIREAEKVKQQKQDEMLALDGILQKKKEIRQTLLDEKAATEKRKAVNEAYAEALKNTPGYDADAAAGKTPEELERAILSEADCVRLEDEIDSYEKAVLKYESEIAALGDLTEEVKDAIEGLDGNVAASLELNEILQERMREYADVSNKLNLAKVIGKRVATLDRERADAQKQLADVSAVAEGHASDLLITKINNGLSAILPRLRVKLKGEGLVVINTDKGVDRELEKLSDEEYAVLTVAVVNAMRQIVSETVHSKVDVRIVKVKVSGLEDATKAALVEFAKKNNLIMIFHK